MAEVVRLSIVYDTSQAVASANRASNALGLVGRNAVRGSGQLKGMALAGLRLSQGLSSGNLSAMALATSLGKLAGGAVLGALVVSVVNVVNAFKEYKRIVDDITDSIHSMQTAARDATEDVARLLGETPPESNAEKAVKRLTDVVAQLRKEARRLGGAAGAELERQAGVLEGQIPGVGKRAAAQRARDEAAAAMKAAIAEITRIRKGPGGVDEREAANALAAVGRLGRHGAMVRDIELLNDELERLAREGDKSSDALKRTADSLSEAEKRLAKFERGLHLMEDGLNIIANSIEDFVTRGTFAFSEFIENIFRLLFRDASGNIIQGIISGAAAGRSPTGTVTVGGGAPITTNPGPSPIVTSNVTFQVQAIDAQSVAQFFEREGDAIAAMVTRRVARSGAMRRKIGGR